MSDRVKTEIEDIAGIDADAIPCSAKTGLGIPDILEKIISFVPAPKESKQPTASINC